MLATPTRVLASVLLATGLALATSAQAAYTDNHGREWRHVVGTTGQTWQSVAAVAPTDGVTPITNPAGGTHLLGWVWATDEQVRSLFSDFVPEILVTPDLGGPAYVLQGLGFFSVFRPTFEYYTTFGGYNYLSGWTATAVGGAARIASVSAQYPVFDGGFSVTGLADQSSSEPYRGLWLYRQTPFHNLGFAKAGTNGAAVLRGSGTLSAGTTTTLDVLGGKEGAPALVAIGSRAVNVPLLGGTFVPSRDLGTVRTTLDAYGQLTLSGLWPAGIASGSSVYVQVWFADAGATGGAAATNAIRIDVP